MPKFCVSRAAAGEMGKRKKHSDNSQELPFLDCRRPKSAGEKIKLKQITFGHDYLR